MLAAWLAACVAPPPRPMPSASAAPNPEAAEAAERAGEHVLAAREYERLAESSTSAVKWRYALQAIEALINAGAVSQAQTKLENILTTGLDPGLVAYKRVLEARLALIGGAHEQALRLLDEAARVSALPPQLLAEIHQIRAQVELARKNPGAALRNLVRREQYIVDPEAITDNQLQLWTVLEHLPLKQLRAELQRAQDPVLTGWIELALATSSVAVPARRAAVADWRRAHPEHPAGTGVLDLATQTGTGIVGRIERVALLLPLTSEYAVAAAAVRDGFTAMAAAAPGTDRPTVTVYDIGADATQAPTVYERAVRDGAQVVVGPLGRNAIDAVLHSSQLAVPTLVLGHSDEHPETPVPIYQLGLSPEQEARAVAERAYLDGHRQAALLYPASPWGERMQLAFTEHWQRLGGLIVSQQTYNETEVDFSEPIKRLLNIHESEQRRSLLESRIGQKLRFEVRARRDIDFIFLAADVRRGRLLKPQINFHRARNVPVYATSHIYSGRADPLHDTDLDGVIFGDMPWLLVAEGPIAQLRQSLQANAIPANGELDRLYALGVDSFAVLAHLNRIATTDGARYAGVTGSLGLDRDGRLHRHLTWSRFRNGAPRLVDTR